MPGSKRYSKGFSRLTRQRRQSRTSSTERATSRVSLLGDNVWPWWPPPKAVIGHRYSSQILVTIFWGPSLSKPTGINNLRTNYGLLGRKLHTRFPGQMSDVYVLGYPDPTHKRVGNEIELCQEILEDLVGAAQTGVAGHVVTSIRGNPAPDLEIGRSEQKDLVSLIQAPLNNSIKNGAADNGWSFVPTSFEFANGHGYCARPPVLRPPPESYTFVLRNPYPNPVPQSDTVSSWFRRAGHSMLAQGPLSFEGICGIYCVSLAAKTHGTMHPNELGHQAAKRLLLSHLVLPVDVPGNRYGRHEQQPR